MTVASDKVALAMQYESGVSVPRDYGRALTLYCEAARRGDPRAFYGLGWMYLNGRGVARDDAIGGDVAAQGGGPRYRAGGKSAAIAFPSLAGSGAGLSAPGGLTRQGRRNSAICASRRRRPFAA